MESLVRLFLRARPTTKSLQPIRQLHITAPSLARKSQRKQQLAAQRAEEAQAGEKKRLELQRLRNSKFLNSLIRPDPLFKSTQISQHDNAAEAKDTTVSGPSAVDASESSTDVKASADMFPSNEYHSFVTADEIKLVSDIAPEAVVELSGGHNRLINTQRQTDQAKRQGEIVKKILALENSDSKAILHANIQKAVKVFSRCERDTGSPEVQIRINSLGEHLAVHRKDHHNKRSFVQLLHKRAKMLRYLKRQSLERYHRCLKELGLLPEMVEGEILAPRYVEKGVHF